MRVNRPILDNGWRVGMPFGINANARVPQSKTVTITAMDGKNHEVTLKGYGKPEWNTVDR